jgi:tetratricopeptide (TPR) repeat protein
MDDIIQTTHSNNNVLPLLTLGALCELGCILALLPGTLMLQGQFEAAIEDYTTAIELNPSHCRAYYNRAFSHDKLHQYEAAISDYTQALEIEPGNATALHNRGSLFERLGR